MSGVPYPPPDNILPIFDREDFIDDTGGTGGLDIATAQAFFVKYPTETRSINLGQITTTGLATFNAPVDITDPTASTSPTTGALVISGGVGISNGDLTVANNVSASSVSALNVYVNDGANQGRIYQAGTEMILQSSGNKVVVDTDNNLVFKNDNTIQPTAYTAREILDDCEAHTFIYNANASPARYMLSSTYPINQTVPTANYAVTVNRIYLFPIRLIKGQVLNGAGFYLAVSGTCTGGFVLYSKASPAARLAQTATNASLSTGTSMKYIDFTTPASYTVPATDIYYLGFNAASIGTSINMVAVATNTFVNYGQTAMTSGVLDKAAQYVSATGFPFPSLSGFTPVIQDRVGYGVVYSNNAT